MTFDSDKKSILSKIDKSKIGSVDKEILPLIKKINSSDDYYTTSSCAGRIMIISLKSERKNEAEWLLLTHKKTSFKEVKNSLKKLPKSEVWFMQEAPILHVATRTLEDAQELVNKARGIGFRRSGIQSTKTRFIVEIVSTEKIDSIIADKGKLLVDDNYLKILVKLGNSKLIKSREKIAKFYKLLEK
jgi:tRNA wybutosine-synthesizing protein 3